MRHVVHKSISRPGIACAVTHDENETAISVGALERAKAVALEHTGSGRVTETEVGDQERHHEVEVTLPTPDVQLDESLNVVGSESDSGNDD